MLDVGRQQLRGLADDSGDVARAVDDRVPASPAEGVKAAVAVALELLQVGVDVPVGAPVEESDLVAPVDGSLGDGPAQEDRPPEDQKLQLSYLTGKASAKRR